MKKFFQRHHIRRKDFRNALVELERTNLELRYNNEYLKREVDRIQKLYKILEDNS